MRVDEYGIMLRFDTRFDMSAWTSLSIEFTKPDNTTFTRDNPDVALGTQDVVTPVGTFLANEYVTYTFQQGEVDLYGVWHAEVTYNDGAQNLISAQSAFTVESRRF